MFTGIIKALGTVDALRETGGDLRVTVSADGIAFSEFAIGESIAINGVCLTAC